MKKAKEYLKMIDDERTFASIEAAIKQAQLDIDVKEAISDFCDSISGGFKYSLLTSWVYKLDSWLDEYNNPTIKEETIPITVGIIRKKCGWKKFCNVTGVNDSKINEFSISDRVILDVKISHAKILKLI
jgi:hypothetical protein